MTHPTTKQPRATVPWAIYVCLALLAEESSSLVPVVPPLIELAFLSIENTLLLRRAWSGAHTRSSEPDTLLGIVF